MLAFHPSFSLTQTVFALHRFIHSLKFQNKCCLVSQEAVWSQILDLDAYKGKVPKVSKCENYVAKLNEDGTSTMKTEMAVKVIPGYGVSILSVIHTKANIDFPALIGSLIEPAILRSRLNCNDLSFG